MRVLHVVPSYVPAYRYGGPVRSVDALARAQSALGSRVAVFTTDADGPGRLPVPADRAVERGGVEVRYFRRGAPRRLFRAPDMASALRRRVPEVDVVHLHSVFLWPTWKAARAAERAAVPYVVSPRGILVRDLVRARSRWVKAFWIACVERRTLERAAAIHFTSRLEQREVERFGFRLPAAWVLPNGVDAPDTGTEPAAETSPREGLLFVGRIHWKKGLDLLLEALAALPGVRLTVAGGDDEGMRPRLDELARRLGVAGRVRFLGSIGEEERGRLLASAALLVLPSLSENFGNVVVEAMAAGCPAVVTPGVGAAEVLLEAGAGVVVDFEARALSRTISGLLSSPERRFALGAAGARFARAQLSWTAIAGRFLAAYGELVANAAALRSPAAGFAR